LQHVSRSLIKVFGPARDPFGNFHQLSCHPQAFAHAAQAAVENIIDLQIAAGRQRIHHRPAIAQHTACRPYDKTSDITQPGDQRVRQPEAEILIAGIFNWRGQHLERQYGDRFLIGNRFGRERRHRRQAVIQLAQEFFEARMIA
jgi:hypothetical protein